ncbi:MAG TPA: hypothetical protein PL110_04215, partial [Candidatus Eremiobacteraeota bacterium]|nr:hypothetical protein [Candidatus Eremiobacteraeota bacterium]
MVITKSMESVNPKINKSGRSLYFVPYNFAGTDKVLNCKYIPVRDSVVITSGESGNKIDNNRDEQEETEDLMKDLSPGEKEVISKLLSTGKLTEKEIKSLIKEDREFTLKEGVLPYNISDLSEESKEDLLQYIKTNNLSEKDVKAILKSDDNRREIEQLVEEYFVKEREEAENFCLNMWLEREKAQKNRLKLITSFYDYVNKTKT